MDTVISCAEHAQIVLPRLVSFHPNPVIDGRENEYRRLVQSIYKYRPVAIIEYHKEPRLLGKRYTRQQEILVMHCCTASQSTYNISPHYDLHTVIHSCLCRSPTFPAPAAVD